MVTIDHIIEYRKAEKDGDKIKKKLAALEGYEELAKLLKAADKRKSAAKTTIVANLPSISKEIKPFFDVDLKVSVIAEHEQKRLQISAHIDRIKSTTEVSDERLSRLLNAYGASLKKAS